jgi:hypothetical protein
MYHLDSGGFSLIIFHRAYSQHSSDCEDCSKVPDINEIGLREDPQAKA